MIPHAAREGVRYTMARGTEAGQAARRAGDAPASDGQVEAFVRNRAAPLAPIRMFVTCPVVGGGQPIKDAGQVMMVRME